MHVDFTERSINDWYMGHPVSPNIPVVPLDDHANCFDEDSRLDKKPAQKSHASAGQTSKKRTRGVRRVQPDQFNEFRFVT